MKQVELARVDEGERFRWFSDVEAARSPFRALLPLAGAVVSFTTRRQVSRGKRLFPLKIDRLSQPIHFSMGPRPALSPPPD